MGQMLSNPVSSQLIQRKGNKHLRVGTSHMQGSRPNMEDTDCVLLQLDAERHPDLALFAVFDGHAGTEVSQYLETELAKTISRLEDPMNPEQVTQAVLDVDAAIGQQAEAIRQAGSTACFAILKLTPETVVVGTDDNGDEIKEQQMDLLVANVGDSRALLLRRDGTFEALTEDHKPETPAEQARIEAAGGHVHMNRVDGQLAMSRAMGDFGYKDHADLPVEAQKVIPVPDVGKHKIAVGDSLLLCCDGIVEQLTNEAVAEFLHEQLSGKGHKQGYGGPVDEHEFQDAEDPARIVYNLLHHSVNSGSLDNHSAILVQLADGSDYTQKHKEKEFVVGPWTCFPDKTFRDSFLDDARRHGYEDEEELRQMSAEAESKLPDRIRNEIQEAEAEAASGNGARNLNDPMELLRLVTGEGNGLEFEQRMRLLELLSGGQLQLVRSGDGEGYDDEDEQDEDDEDDEHDEDGDDDDIVANLPELGIDLPNLFQGSGQADPSAEEREEDPQT